MRRPDSVPGAQQVGARRAASPCALPLLTSSSRNRQVGGHGCVESPKMEMHRVSNGSANYGKWRESVIRDGETIWLYGARSEPVGRAPRYLPCRTSRVRVPSSASPKPAGNSGFLVSAVAAQSAKSRRRSAPGSALSEPGLIRVRRGWRAAIHTPWRAERTRTAVPSICRTLAAASDPLNRAGRPTPRERSGSRSQPRWSERSAGP
jgi:hypothetical protein